MKRRHETDCKPSNLPAITLADRDNYQINLYTDDKDRYRLNLHWNCNNSDIPSISINPQSIESTDTDTDSKYFNKHSDSNIITTSKSPDSLPCQSTPNTITSNSLDYPILPKEELCSESLDENQEIPNDFQEEHLDSHLLPDRINEVDSPIVHSDPMLLERDLNSLKNRVTSIEMSIQSMHSMVSEIFEWVQSQKPPIVIESLQSGASNSTPDTFSNGDTPYIQLSHAATQQATSSIGTALPFTSMHTLSHPHRPIFSEFPTEYEVSELKRRSNTRRNFAAKLALRIFSEEGLMMNNSSGKCPEGTIGKLDSTKMMLIKSLVFQHWPLQETEAISQEDFWKLECMRAIDEKGRYLRFQKKSVYKRMLWKKRSGVATNIEPSNFRNFIPYSGNGEQLETGHTPITSAPPGTYSVTLDSSL